MALCTSDIIVEKFETDKKIKQTSREIDALEDVVRDMEKELKKVTMEIGLMEEKQQLKSHGIDDSRKINGLRIMSLYHLLEPLLNQTPRLPPMNHLNS